MKTLISMMASIVLLLGVGSAQATIVIDPTDSSFSCTAPGGNPLDCWTSSITSNLSISQVEGIVGYSGPGLNLFYKSDVGSDSGGLGIDSGSYASSYKTTFSASATDPRNALIEYLGGQAISCPTCYLLVKDGSHDPAQYIFDLGNWNGQESISLLNFWDRQGAISHIAIYGDGVGVPEPAVIFLLGMGLLIMTAMRLRTRRASAL